VRERSHTFVARPRQVQSLRLCPNETMQLCERHLVVVEPLERGE